MMTQMMLWMLLKEVTLLNLIDSNGRWKMPTPHPSFLRSALLRHSVFDAERPPLSIIEAYIGTDPGDEANFLEILWDVTILHERPEFRWVVEKHTKARKLDRKYEDEDA